MHHSFLSIPHLEQPPSAFLLGYLIRIPSLFVLVILILFPLLTGRALDGAFGVHVGGGSILKEG